MSLTQNVRNRIIDAMNVAFDAIGTSAETKMPRRKGGDNRASIAWEYFVSWYLASRARVRHETAKKHAAVAGIIFDHVNHPREEGTNEEIYHGEHVSVWLEVKRGYTRVDPDRMSTYLINKGVDPKLVTDAYMHASTKTRPAHEFKPSLVAPDMPVAK